MIISFSSTARILLTENCIVFATTGHARFEHARVLNNKTRAIPGITVRRYRSRPIPRQLNHCITGIIHTFTASIPGMVGSSLVSKYQNPVYCTHFIIQNTRMLKPRLAGSCKDNAIFCKLPHGKPLFTLRMLRRTRDTKLL